MTGFATQPFWNRSDLSGTIDIRISYLERNVCPRPKRVRNSLKTVLCLGLGLFIAQTICANAKPNPLAKPNVQRGAAQFQQSCSQCHGAEAAGGAGPNLIESSLVRHDEDGNLITPVIQDGRPDKGMPAFPLIGSANISDIVAFLHARIEVADSLELSGPVGGYSINNLLAGSPEAGKQYFYGGGKCSACHSPTGDLAGIANKYQPAELEARLLYPPNNTVMATISLPSGRMTKGKLLHLDAFYVAIQNEEGWYRSWPLPEVTVKVDDPLAGHLKLLHDYTDKDIHNVFSYLETLK